MPVPVVIPVKPLAEAKMRLSPVLDRQGRATLAAWMLDRTLAAVAAARIGPIRIVGGDPQVVRIAQTHGALTLPELGQGLNDSLARALELVRGVDRESCIVLAADLPRLTSEDIRQLWLASEGGRRGVLAPSYDDGTNALVVPAGCVFHPSFGGDSRHSHRKFFEKQGCAVREMKTHGLLNDVDRPGDLVDLMKNLPPGDARNLAQLLQLKRLRSVR